MQLWNEVLIAIFLYHSHVYGVKGLLLGILLCLNLWYFKDGQKKYSQNDFGYYLNIMSTVPG